MKMKMKLAILLTPTAALAATLEHITEPLASNPRNVSFYIYVPDNLPPAPPILVNPHWCHGSPQAAFAGSQFANLADRYGYIVIYPGSPNAADQCWDVSSKETLTHEGGGDSLGIVSMVKWTINRYGADAGRVFVTGVSSGAMMSQVLLGAYPDVFAAGASFAGVPFGCYEPENSEGKYGYWHDGCARGQVIKSAEEWGNRVRAAYPGYDGWRPKVALFHGTADEVVSYVNHGEAVKEWTNVLGLGDQPTQVVSNTPLSGWTKSVYGNGWLQAWSAQGVPHDIKVQENTVVEFFQLDCDGADCFRWGQGSPGGGNGQPGSTTVPSTRTSTSTSARPTTTTFTTVVSTPVVTPPPATSAQTLWGQCGGSGYVGPTVCAEGLCTTYNPWYAQCIPRTW